MQGYLLQTHDDVPPDVRDQLYAEDQQGSGRRRKRATSCSSEMPPIKITNVLPAQSASPDLVPRSASEPVEVLSRTPAYLGIAGPRDVAVKQYTEWHCSKVSIATWKVDFQKACRLTLEEGFDLEHVYADGDAQFYINGGIK